MKVVRKVMFVLAMLGITVLLCFTLLACQDDLRDYRSLLSDVRRTIYVGESEHFEMRVYLGEREKPYALDGVANPLQSYFVVMVSPKFEMDPADTLAVQVTIEGKKYYKKLDAHPFNGSYGGDFTEITSASDSLSINVTAKHYDEDVVVHSLLTSEMYTAEEAFQLGMQHLEDSVKNTQKNGNYSCEIQVKLVDKTQYDGKIFWHISAFDQSGEMYAVLISAFKNQSSATVLIPGEGMFPEEETV